MTENHTLNIGQQEISKHKRIARLRAKKVKALGLIEDSLNEADIFFINSLTNTELIKLGNQCGIILNQAS